MTRYDTRALPVDMLLSDIEERELNVEERERYVAEHAEYCGAFQPDAERLARQYRDFIQERYRSWCPAAGGHALATQLIDMIKGDAGATDFVAGMQRALDEWNEGRAAEPCTGVVSSLWRATERFQRTA